MHVVFYRGDRNLLTWIAKTLTPPVPSVNTQSPGLRGLRPYRAFHAVKAAQLKVLDSSQLRLFGSSTSPSSLKTPYSRSAPSRDPPRPVCIVLKSREPATWPWLKRVATRSPTLNRVTLPPTASTDPAPSEPGTTPDLQGNRYLPCPTSRQLTRSIVGQNH